MDCPRTCVDTDSNKYRYVFCTMVPAGVVLRVMLSTLLLVWDVVADAGFQCDEAAKLW